MKLQNKNGQFGFNKTIDGVKYFVDIESTPAYLYDKDGESFEIPCELKKRETISLEWNTETSTYLKTVDVKEVAWTATGKRESSDGMGSRGYRHDVMKKIGELTCQITVMTCTSSEGEVVTVESKIPHFQELKHYLEGSVMHHTLDNGVLILKSPNTPELPTSKTVTIDVSCEERAIILDKWLTQNSQWLKDEVAARESARNEYARKEQEKLQEFITVAKSYGLDVVKCPQWIVFPNIGNQLVMNTKELRGLIEKDQKAKPLPSGKTKPMIKKR